HRANRSLVPDRVALGRTSRAPRAPGLGGSPLGGRAASHGSRDTRSFRFLQRLVRRAVRPLVVLRRVVDTSVLRAADHRISPMARRLAQGWAGPAAGHGTDPAPGDPRVAREIEPLAADDALHVPVGLPLTVTARRCQALQLV